MKLNEQAQNLGARIVTIQIVGFVLLVDPGCPLVLPSGRSRPILQRQG